MESYKAAWCLLFFIVKIAKGGEYKIAEQEKALYDAYLQCQFRMQTEPVNLTGVFCKRQFDDILCWPDSPPGVTVKQHCPGYINLFDQTEFALKTCLEDGTWYVNPETNKTWTNYSRCIEEADTQLSPLIKDHMPRVKLLYTVGYSVSLAALVLAIFIMLYFRRLRCPRNLIHVNLFSVYTIRAFISLLKEVLLVEDIGFPNDVVMAPDGKYQMTEGSHWGCKMFFTLFNYIIMTSICWIFVEGLYLQLILSFSLKVEKVKLRWFLLYGWGAPLLFVVPWGVTRYYLDDVFCWNVGYYRKDLFWIINGPIVITVIVTFIIFCNIMRLLITKLNASNCSSSRRYRYRRLAKSTLILIPLFAVYYMIFIWLPEDLPPLPSLVQIYIEMLFNSFQGFLVALLFCFCNAEVQHELKKTYRRRFVERENGLVRKSSKRYSSRSFNSETDNSGVYKHPKKEVKPLGLSDIREESVPFNLNNKVNEVTATQDHNDNLQNLCDRHNFGVDRGSSHAEDVAADSCSQSSAKEIHADDNSDKPLVDKSDA